MEKRRMFFGLMPLKRLMQGAAVLAAFAVLGSCVTKPVIFDESIPPEETASLVFVQLLPTSYNGITVDKMKWIWTHIPAGPAVFVCDINAYNVTGKDFIFVYTFEGGKDYCLYYDHDGENYGVNVYNSLPPKVGWPPKDTLIAFVPFENQPDTITTTYRSW
jgi:hypothetical protein